MGVGMGIWQTPNQTQERIAEVVEAALRSGLVATTSVSLLGVGVGVCVFCGKNQQQEDAPNHPAEQELECERVLALLTARDAENLVLKRSNEALKAEFMRLSSGGAVTV